MQIPKQTSGSGGWLFVGVPLLLITSLWLWIKSTTPDTILTIWTYISQISSLWALVLFTITLILSARLRIIERIFGGFDLMYRWHKYVGILATLLAVTHFVAVLLDHTDDLAYYLLPTTSTLIKDLGISAGIISLYGIIILLLLTYVSKLPYHIWKLTHEYMGFFFILGGLHAILASSDAIETQWMNWTLLGMTQLGILAFCYTRFAWRWFPSRTPYIVDHIETRGAISDIYLAPVHDKLDFRPGQFVYLEIPGVGASRETHPFTISSSPTQHLLRLSVKDLGDYTSRLKDLQQGNAITVNGPYGTFGDKFVTSNKPVTFIAGGIGITPFLSLLTYVRDTQSTKQIDIWYMTRTPEEAVYTGEIEQTIANSTNVNIHLYQHYSKTMGYIDFERAFLAVPDLLHRQFFICGPTQVMNQSLNTLIQLGVKKRNIIMEDFSFKN